MKKQKSLLLVLTLLFLMVLSVPASAKTVAVKKGGKDTTIKGTLVTVKFNGDKITSAQTNKDAPAMIINDTVYIPAKTLLADNEKVGATYTYNSDKKTATIKYGDRKIVYTSNSKKAKANGTTMNLRVKPFIVTFKDSGIKDMMVPAKQTALFLGWKYNYSKKTVTLKTRAAHFTSARRATSISKKQFINTIGKIAAKDYKESGILASVTIAQAILESGWGKSNLAKNANNLFGIKCGRYSHNWKNSTWDGKNSRKGFRKYSCVEDSIADHSAYLVGSLKGKRYKGITKTKSYKKQLQIIRRGGYCTSSSYVSQLTRIIKKYKLTKWDHK